MPIMAIIIHEVAYHNISSAIFVMDDIISVAHAPLLEFHKRYCAIAISEMRAFNVSEG